MDLSRPPRIAAMGVGIHGTPRHEQWLLPDLWCLHVYGYRARLAVDGQNYAIEPGFVSIVPPGKLIEYDYEGRSVHVFVHFQEKPNDNAEKRSVSLQAVQNLGPTYASIENRLTKAIERSIGYGPEMRSAIVWSLLWELADAGHDDTSRLEHQTHPKMRQAMQIIELRYGETLSVAEIAAECDISYSYLSKLFRAEVGDSVIGYILRRRMDIARHLLTCTTLPIKAIGAHVGIPDPHLFNKTVRRYLGSSPRRVRIDGT